MHYVGESVKIPPVVPKSAIQQSSAQQSTVQKSAVQKWVAQQSLMQKIIDSDGFERVTEFALAYKAKIFVAMLCLVITGLFFCLLSYSPSDVAWSHSTLSQSWEQGAVNDVTNIGGRVGAVIADILYGFFGWSAWACLLWLGLEAYFVLKARFLLPLRWLSYALLWPCVAMLTFWLGEGAYAIFGSEAFGGEVDFASGAGGYMFGGIIGLEYANALTGLLGKSVAIGFVCVFVLGIGYLLISPSRASQNKTSRDKSNQSPTHATKPIIKALGGDNLSTSDLPTSSKANKSLTKSPSAQAKNPSPKPKGVLQAFLQYSELSTNIDELPLSLDDDTATNAVPSAQAPTSSQAQKPKAPPITITTSQKPLRPAMLSSQQNNYFDDYNNSHTTGLVGGSISNNGNNDNNTNNNNTNNDNYPKAEYNKHNVINNVPNMANPSTASLSTAPQASEPATAFAGINLDALPALETISPSGLEMATNLPNRNTTNFNTANLNAPNLNATSQNLSVNNPNGDNQLGDTSNNLANHNQSIQNPAQPPLSSDNQLGDKASQHQSAQSTSHQLLQNSPSDTPSNDSLSNDTPSDSTSNNNHYYPSHAIQTAKHRQSLSPLPSVDLLDPKVAESFGYSHSELTELANLLQIKLKDFNISGEVKNIIQGPVVTSFEVELAAGVRASRVTGIASDLARSLALTSLRVVEVIAGKPYIGIEIPNKSKETVKLIELVQSDDYQTNNLALAMAMGKSLEGKPIIADLAQAPHMLVAGTTGSGKSVLINAILLSFLLKYTPSELRLVIIDPKIVEFTLYIDIPHLITPVVTDMPSEALPALSWCVAEMERRYQLMNFFRVRKIAEFNQKLADAEAMGKPLLDPLWDANDSLSQTPPKLKPLPLIVVVVDEYADLVMQIGKPVEELVVRLVQKARAASIHLIIATQRPSVDVITGLIKSNVPSRAALKVKDKINSRTVLDASGAEELLGNGDMLFVPPASNDMIRVHAAYVTNAEVERICEAWRERGTPDYVDLKSDSGDFIQSDGDDNDPLYNDGVAFFVDTGKVSISSLQRKLGIGYNRAANLVEAMERRGVVSPPDNSNKRTLLL